MQPRSCTLEMSLQLPGSTEGRRMSRSGADFIFGACERGSDLQKSCVAPFPLSNSFLSFWGNVKITTVAPALSDRQGRQGFLQVALVSVPVLLRQMLLASPFRGQPELCDKLTGVDIHTTQWSNSNTC